MRYPSALFASLIVLLAPSVGAEPLFQGVWQGSCTTISGAGTATSSAFTSFNPAAIGNHLVMVIATDSTGTISINDNLGAGGLGYSVVHNNNQTTSGNAVRMFVYVAPVGVGGVTQVNGSISGGTSGREICTIGEEFSGMSATAPFVERTGNAFAATTADPYAISLGQTTATPDQTLFASFARYNYPGGSGVQPYPLHGQSFSNTNAELSLDVGSGPALTAGQNYTRQFDPNVATPFAGISVSLRPVSPFLFANGFE